MVIQTDITMKLSDLYRHNKFESNLFGKVKTQAVNLLACVLDQSLRLTFFLEKWPDHIKFGRGSSDQ